MIPDSPEVRVMATLPGMPGDVYWGDPERPLPDWRTAMAGAPEADAEDPTEGEHAAAVGILGFDPRTEPGGMADAGPDDGAGE